jgi:hypothetical protein
MKVLKKSEVVRRRQVEHTRAERRIMGGIDHPFVVALRFAFQPAASYFLQWRRRARVGLLMHALLGRAARLTGAAAAGAGAKRSTAVAAPPGEKEEEPPGELAFELTWCAGSGGNTMLCPNAERQRILAFNDGSLTPWYLPQSVSNGRMLFTKQNMGTFTTYTAAPVGCWCHSGPRVMAGSFFANVAALHRTSNDVMRYRVSQRLTPYPGAFTLDGGAQTCPVVDGGCGFAR